MSRPLRMMLALVLPAASANAEIINGLNIDCTVQIVEAYSGVDSPFDLEVIHINGKPVAIETARAFYQMYLAAKADGVPMVLVSGFRTMEQQKKLFWCWTNKSGSTCPAGCSSCNQAAVPGTSKHQKGNALDIESNGGTNSTYKWLKGLSGWAAHGPQFGFLDTFNPPEPWHWAYINPGSYVGPCDPQGPAESSLVCTPKAVAGAEGSFFKDVLPTSTFATAIDAIAAVGITTGCQPSIPLFCPQCVTTRAQMVTFIIRALGVPVPTPASSSFTDVSTTAYYFPYVEKAKELGITSGCTPTTFCPENPVTREQAAKFIVEAMGWPQISPASPSFTDIDKFKWSYPYIETLADYCVTTGCGPGTFCPGDPLTREQAALMLARALDLEDHNPCLQACDAAGCDSSDYCGAFDACGGFVDVCDEAGTHSRTCWDYACEGNEKIASCVADIEVEITACSRDTDGVVVSDWVEVGSCSDPDPCAQTGAQLLERVVCSGGAMNTKMQTISCALEPSCAEALEPALAEPGESAELVEPVEDAGSMPDPIGKDIASEPDGEDEPGEVSPPAAPDKKASAESAATNDSAGMPPSGNDAGSGAGASVTSSGSGGSSVSGGCRSGPSGSASDVAGLGLLVLIGIARDGRRLSNHRV